MDGDDEVFAAFAEESRSLDAFLAELTPQQWSQPSACAGWSVADVVLHLAQSEEGVIASFDDGDAGRPYAPYIDELFRSGAGDADGVVDALVDAAVRAERPDDPLDALARWRTANAAVLHRFAAADPRERLPWITVPLAARTMVATRLAEHWIHSMDIREPLGAPAGDTARLRPIARLAWRTLPYAFERAGEAAPSVAVQLQCPDGEPWVFGDPDSAEVVVRGPAGAWCRLAARRCAPGDADLEARGEGAGRVLELVRTYA